MKPVQSAMFLVFGLAASLGGASLAYAVEFRNGDRVEIAGSFTDSLFATGREVILTATSSDDVFAGARDIEVRQLRADHLFAAAANMRFDSGEARDAVVAAGDIRFNGGRITDDLMAAAGSLRLSPTFGVGGSAILTGGELEVSAPIGGDLSASGGAIRLDGVVTGAVDLTAERIVIGPNARLGGDLTYSAESIEISPSAIVTGRRIVRPSGEAKTPRGLIASAIGAAAMAVLVFIVGGAVLVLAAASAFPGLMNRAAARVEAQPVTSVGIGFLLLVIGPVLVGLLFVSLVGLPLGLLVAALYLAATPLALAASVYWLGMRARRAVARGRPLQPPRGWARFGWSLLAVVALMILGSIPAVGGLVWLIALVVGLGAVAVEGRRGLSEG